jgi:GTP cyclohydrolase I
MSERIDARPSGDDEELVRGLLRMIGEDPTREGLRDTPARVVKAWKEWASGYRMDPAAILKTFEDGAPEKRTKGALSGNPAVDEMVIVHNIPVVSKCEHHMADIIGIAHVGYIPDQRIVGLSKLARLVEVYARRLQVQERMTNQIADDLMQHLQPIGAGCIIRAAHHCMSTRGVRIHGSVTTTCALRGAIFLHASTRAEFLQLCRDAQTS